jgi:hypothetical protein
MMSGLFMIAGFMMFGCLAMMLGRVLMMLRGVLVVLMNLVVVHGSLSGHLEKTGSIEAFDEPFATPRCQIGASAALRRAAGAFAELRHVLSYLPHDIVPIAEARLPVKPCGRIPWTVRPPARPAEIRGVGSRSGLLMAPPKCATAASSPADAPERALPARRQRGEAAQDESLPPSRMLGIIELQARQAAQQRGDRNLALDAGELGTEAVVDAAAERQRAHVGARDVEPVGVGVDGGVAIGRTEQAYDRLALGQRDTADLVDVFERGAASNLHGRIIAQEFFDGAGGKRGILAQ